MSGSLRLLWVMAGLLSLAVGVIGIVVPVLPTTPFVLLAAFCFSRGSARFERWLLDHRLLGPIVLDWREHRAVPLPAKRLAYAMMAASSLAAAFLLPLPWAAVPAACCTAAAYWLWRLPTRIT